MNASPLSICVLVVDATESMHDLYRRLFGPDHLGQRNNYEVVMVSDGESASKELENFEPDILVTDTRTPGANCIELARAVIQKNANARIVFATSPGAVDPDAMRGVPGSVMLLKPFDASDFILTIDAAAGFITFRRQASGSSS